MPIRPLALLMSMLLLLPGCGREESGTIAVAFVDSGQAPFAQEFPLSGPARHLRAATDAGLVALNAEGEVIPALADQWIVTDDGLSYIFRLRDVNWPDGDPLSADSARAALRKAITGLRGTSLGLGSAKISEVRAMAGRVVEIRLKSPMPEFLQLLAQPELALVPDNGAAGPMELEREGGPMVLDAKTPEQRGLPAEDNWRQGIRPLTVEALPAEEAIRRFDAGAVDVVLGGRIDSIPLVDTGPLSRGTVRLDPAIGLFGLQVYRDEGLLATAEGREAVAMAIDRAALLEPFGIGGWAVSERIVPPGAAQDLGLPDERWAEQTIEQRRAEAARRVAVWRTQASEDELGPQIPELTVRLGEGPGLDRLFAGLAQQLATIGVTLRRVEEEGEADLMLVDRTARYAGARWFLDQLSCSLGEGLCAPDADNLVEQSLTEQNGAARADLLAEAERRLTAAGVFIPIAQPLRWSLVRSTIAGFSPNAWAFHPLSDIAGIPR
ncbi:ABC transporter substrate-binding protein [Altericroceibacterium xinjiangense]|uniref:ABC transporter substrate-binding protein n=1 Tax=Altericroceibacterium xinjiangense TaxID=762261 RepID=UPI001F49AD3C|nr:ABC transporter substrate-binding protein [Altericroceibacterium xinjiangense]